MRLWIIILLMLNSIALQAGLITGYITNGDGEPLPFASIYIMGTTVGTASNPEGYFELPPASEEDDGVLDGHPGVG